MEKEKSCLFSDVLFTSLVILCVVQIVLTQTSKKVIINSNKQLMHSLDENTKTYNELILKINYATGE